MSTNCKVMCNTHEKVKEIIDLALAQHELKDIQRHVQFDDKLDKTLIAVRDSIPPYLSPTIKKMIENVDKIDKRLKKTENVITYHTGVMVGIGSVIGIAWLVIGDWLKNKLLN